MEKIFGEIRLNEMEFYAFHGHYPIEQTIGGKFTVSISLKAAITEAAINDDISGTIDYQAVYLLIKKIMLEPVKLIEHLAFTIKSAIEQNFKDATVVVTVTKHNPVLGGAITSTSVKV